MISTLKEVREALANSQYDDSLRNYGMQSEAIIKLDALIAQVEKAEPVGINGLTQAKENASMSVRGLSKAQPAPSTSPPLTVKQRVDIADACEEMDFDDDYLGIVSKVIDLTEAAHKIGAKPC